LRVPKQWNVCTNLQLIICLPPVCFLLTTYSYSPPYTGAKEQLARGEIFLEQKDIVVMFCAKTMEGGHISRLEKGKVDNYLQEICIGSQCLRSNLDLLHKRHRAGVFGFGNVKKLEESLEEPYAICDETIDSLTYIWLC
jgi:hypothetical protein